MGRKDRKNDPDGKLVAWTKLSTLLSGGDFYFFFAFFFFLAAMKITPDQFRNVAHWN